MGRYSKESLKLSTPLVIAAAACLAVCVTLYMPVSRWLQGNSPATAYGIHSQHQVVHSTPGIEFGSFIVTLRPF
jgi:hypothetical protein